MLYPKMLQIKIVEHWIPYKKVSGRICLFSPGMELGAPKIAIFWNLLMFRNRKVDSLWGSMLLKILTISNNAPNKSRWALNSIQKSQRVHMSTTLQSGAKELRRLIRFKYYIVREWKSRFNLGLDTAKNTHYMRKGFK